MFTPRTLVWLLCCLLCSACVAPSTTNGTQSQSEPDRNGRGLFVDAQGASQWRTPEELSTYSGTGRYRWPDGRTYDGQWRDGKPQGTGAGTLTDGSHYQGQWQAGQPHGQGQQKTADSLYEGEFAAGVREGQGVERNSAGIYQGQWRNNQPHGQGVYRGTDGGEYQGQYQQGNRHGTGRYLSANGSIYEGDWLEDEPSGFGVLLSAEGGRHEGQWLAGQSDGYGVYAHPAGLTYKGTWKGGQRSGFGEERRPDGSHYEGDWQANVPHGQGTMHFPNGDSHQGQWRDGAVGGPGERVYLSGYQINGDWQGALPTTGTLQLRDQSANVYQGELYSGDQNTLALPALEWLKTHADNGNPAAALVLADELAISDPEAATPWYTQAAQDGIAAAQYTLGRALLDSDIRLAVGWLNKAANAEQSSTAVVSSARQREHADAQFLLGTLYHFGERLPQDEDQAESFYQAAIANGHLPARRNLALMLATTSIDYLYDPERALELIEPIANLYQSPPALDALATVLAANERYADAAATQQAAVEALTAQPTSDDLTQVIAEMRNRAAQYQQLADPAASGVSDDPG